MDTRKLTDLLRATIDPNQRQQAEQQLDQIHKIIGFAPMLLQVIMMNDLDMPVRQAGVIYLKNLVTGSWQEREAEVGQPMVFCIHEQDRAMIRDSIVDAVVHSPDLIRLQLAVCVSTIIKHDFPGRWTQIVDKISIYLQNPDADCWAGALLCLYQLVKNFEYKKTEDRGPLNEAMILLLPMIYRLCVTLLADISEKSVLFQKQILKIYFALTQYTLPLELINKEIFSQWMEIVRAIADRPIPDHVNTLDEDERQETVWWKCKKWALHIIYRMFERYGSPGNVSKEYSEFADWYLATFTAGIIEVILKVLDQYRNQIYVSSRVLQQSLNYINQSVSHATCWSYIKPHMMAIIQDVVFPIMSYSDDDHELWLTDPQEYIRIKFDVFEDFVSPITAAQTLLHSCCKKRKNMLQKTMQLIIQILNDATISDNKKDGALHMVGTLADVLLKRRSYKDQVENMFVQYVFPQFNNSRGHMRARACWVLHYFSEIHFKQEAILSEALRFIIQSLLHDKDLPVKVEAAIALQSMLNYQERAHKYIEVLIKPISLELLKVIRETENEDLTNVLQKIVCTFTKEITPIAVEMCQHLAHTFSNVLETDEGSDEKAITAMGLLNTIETLLTVMEDQQEIMTLLEPTVLQVVGHIFQQGNVEFYEEALSLVYDLTSKKISPDMWKMLELIYQVFQKNGFDHFVDMMPALHNYVTVDTPTFLSNESYLLAMFSMAKAVMTADSGEDAECHAAKLIEVIILQCKNRIDQCIQPLVELVLNRLMREVKTSELRTMCLQVVIAALYYNPQLLFQILEKLPLPTANESISTHFIKQWIHDTDCFLGLHDRKMCVLGLCTLISMTPGRPVVLNECANQIIPSLILLFDGLKRAYVAKAQELTEEESSEEEDDDIEGTPGSKYWKFKKILLTSQDKVLSSDEDEIDEHSADYLEKLARSAQQNSQGSGFNVMTTINDVGDGESDSDEDYDPNEETTLESYGTPLDESDCEIDEYIVFKDVMTRLQMVEPSWYASLTAGLTPEQQKSLQEIIILADQRKAALESRKIEQSGGYAFTQQTVPTTFKFGNASLGH